MRTLLQRAAVAVCGLFIASSFSGCLKDECRNTYTIYRPIYQSLSAVRSQMRWEGPRKVSIPGKIYLYGKYVLVNDLGSGIHVFDNSQPARPQQVGFLRIGGNVDMAVRNNVLYADSYADLAVVPIQNWTAARPVAFQNKVFADRNHYWGNKSDPDSVQVITGFETKDTVVDCATQERWNNCPNCTFADAGGSRFLANASAAKAAVSNGTGGSMARFTLVDEYLYTVTTSELAAFSLREPLNPAKVAGRQLGWDIETIFPFRDKLFIGSMTGMYIFDIANPANPVQQGMFSHARRCDPVVADGRYAYVTLRSTTNGGFCPGNTNELNVVDVENLMQPKLVRSYPLSGPSGLSKDGNLLFVCDGKAGLLVFDATDPNNLQKRQTLTGLGQTYDVIAQDGLALVVTDNGLYQFDYRNPAALKQVSKIALTR